MGSSHAPEDTRDIFEMFNESETEVGSDIEIRDPRWAMPSMVESSESEEKPQV